jgi:hypothetical protein
VGAAEVKRLRRRVVPHHVELGLEGVHEQRVIGEQLGFVVEVGGRHGGEFGRREVARAELHDVLADEERHLPVIDFRKPRGVEAETDGHALAGEPVELRLRVRVGLEYRAAIAHEADRHAGMETIRDRDRDGVLAQVPARDIEPHRLRIDLLDEYRGHIVDGREIDAIGGGGVVG